MQETTHAFGLAKAFDEKEMKRLLSMGMSSIDVSIKKWTTVEQYLEVGEDAKGYMMGSDADNCALCDEYYHLDLLCTCCPILKYCYVFCTDDDSIYDKFSSAKSTAIMLQKAKEMLKMLREIKKREEKENEPSTKISSHKNPSIEV